MLWIVKFTGDCRQVQMCCSILDSFK